ncbi:hypothetical protein [Piscirickettsia litoralis]|uniref:Uncharacterized protein n=1 Tax=Piscirickettsia litoralis TaxID=1891921 RepID=A0ABX3A6V6_9GAMM|nr:hypothetical protein [Piscirickettsia litoralis]ODN43373.1 hypothetical protein BGC07_11115 [Piscirickettsia litoralis]
MSTHAPLELSSLFSAEQIENLEKGGFARVKATGITLKELRELPALVGRAGCEAGLFHLKKQDEPFDAHLAVKVAKAQGDKPGVGASISASGAPAGYQANFLAHSHPKEADKLISKDEFNADILHCKKEQAELVVSVRGHAILYDYDGVLSQRSSDGKSYVEALQPELVEKHPEINEIYKDLITKRIQPDDYDRLTEIRSHAKRSEDIRSRTRPEPPQQSPTLMLERQEAVEPDGDAFLEAFDLI